MISPSQNTAQLAGMYFGALLMAGFTVLSASALRRRSANKKCVLSLTFLLGGWAIATLGAAISRQSQLGPVAQMIPSLLFVVLVIVSVVLGIIGLVEFGANRGRFRRGRKRAIFALVLDVLVVTFAIAGFVRGVSGGGSFSPIAGGASAQPVANEEWNFRLNPPPGWMQADVRKLNPLARVSLTRTAPTAFFMVLTEKLPVGVPVNLNAAAEVIKGPLKVNNGKFIVEEPLRDHGIDGLRLESEAAPGGMNLYFIHWIAHHHGILYQLVTWGPPATRDAIRAQSDKLRAGFEIIDPNRSAVPASARAKSVHASSQYGYAIDCRDTDWTLRWENLAKDLPDADYGVMNSSGSACLCVIPVWIGDGDPDLDALVHALAGRIGIPFPDDNIYGLKDWQQGKGAGLAKGRAFAFERNVEGTDLLYRLRVLRHLNFAYLLAAWFDKAHESRTDMLDEGLDRVYFAPPPLGQPRRAEMNDRALIRHGIVCNEIGLWHDRRGESEAAREWFGRAVELGKPDPIVALNYAETTARLGKTDEALTFLDGQMAKFPGDAKLVSKRAEIQLQSGNSEAATKGLATLFESGFRDDAQFAGFIEMLCEKGDTEAAFAALDKYGAGKQTPALRRTRATIHQYRREFDKAADILREVLKDSPGDAQAALMLADCYFGAERYGDAITECDKLIADHRDSAYVHRRKGFAQLSLKRYREAKVSLEKAHEKSPGDAELKRTLDYVSGLLGEGANTLVKKPIEPVAIPDDLLAEPPADKAAAYLAGFDAWYPQSVRAIEFVKGRELRTTERQVIKVVAQQGVEKFSTLEFRFDPLSEEIFVNSLSVKDASGEVIATGKADDSYVVDDGADAMATQGKILHVPVPGLKPGCTLEFTVTRREVGSVEAFTFRPHLFSKAFPVLRSTLFVRAPQAAVKWEATSGIAAKKLDGALLWSVDQPAIYRWEPLQAPLESFSPMVWVADSGASWQSEAKSYLGQIKDRLALDETIRAAAAEAAKGLRTEAEKTAALARFVQRELTYKAIEFGRRARVPNPAAQTLRNKYGDCKDHALLLAQLLEAAGIEARLALVNTGSPLRPGLPSLDQFNHMIVFVPSSKGGIFVDCTSKSADLTSGPPQGLATLQTLVLDPEKPRLVAVPDYSSRNVDITATREITLQNDNDASVDETLVFTGPFASSMRLSLQNIEPAHRTRYLHQTMHRELSALELRDAQIENIERPQEPLKMKLKYVIRQKFQTVGQQLIGQLPAVWERIFLASIPVEERQTPFKVWVPTSFASNVTIAVPSGWKVTASESKSLEKPFCAATVESRLEQRKLKLESKLTQRTGQFPAAEYRAFNDAMSSALGLVERNVVFKKGE